MEAGVFSCLIETTRFITQDGVQIECLTQVAYQAHWVYLFLVTMMVLSAVGLPIPEEVTLITVGFLAHIASLPELYPPPVMYNAPVNPLTTAIVAFFAVFLSDFIIFMMGRLAGPKVFAWGPIKRIVNPTRKQKIENWTKKYGALACGIFRFTPGIRFPGHLACGMVGIPPWKFLLIDGFAVLLSVPTQIFIFAHYGKDILQTFQKYKFIVLGILIVLAIVYAFNKWRQGKTQAA